MKTITSLLTHFMFNTFIFSIVINVFLCNTSDVGYIVHFTDPHYDQYYKVGAANNCLLGSTGMGCCRKTSIPIKPYGYAGKYGDFNCDSPELLLDQSFNFFSEMFNQDTKIRDNIDFAFMTGDCASHHDVTQTLEQNMYAVQKVTDLFNQSFNDQIKQIIPSIGNHDTWPTDQLTPPSQLFNNGTILSESLTKIWRPWIKDQKAIDQLYYGGYYSLDMNNNLKVLSLNSLYYDSHNRFDRNRNDTAHYWDWLENELEDSFINKQKVWIIGHIYPGSGEASYNFTVYFQDLVAKYTDTITGNFWGHSHHDQYFLYREKDNKVINYGFISPSIMPSGQNPGFRLYHYNRTSYKIVDYDQYYLNLTLANNGSEFKYELEYSFRNYYRYCLSYTLLLL